jgi:hypothetical protein
MQHWPRVSTILKILDPEAYSNVPSGVLAVAAERGERLHRLCLSYLASLDGLCEKPSEIRAEDAAAYLSFQRWVELNQVKPVAIEEPSVCTQYQYRGTPDALVTFGLKQILVLIDLKFTAAIQRTNKVQIQAYSKLDLYKEAKQLMLIHITPKDGHLKQDTIKPDPRDWAAFLNALSVHRWRTA